MKISNKRISEEDLYFWVEEGQASLGNFETALKYINTAAEVGADGIEFQLAIPEEFYVSSHPYIEHYKKIQYSDCQLKELINASNKVGIDFIAAVLSHSLIPFLVENGCSAFVINASDINNPGIIDPVIVSGLPFFISLPLASTEEIEWVIQRCKAKGATNFTLMLGQHTMASGDKGVMPEDSNLGYLSILKKNYGLPVGYIDHSAHQAMPSIARAAGANFISKHLVLNKQDKGPDWFVCLEPTEMKTSIDFARRINSSLNQKDKVLAPGENMDVSKMRRSIVADENIPKGTPISHSMLAFKRTEIPGIPPHKFEEILNKKTVMDIRKDEIINTKMFQ